MAAGTETPTTSLFRSSTHNTELPSTNGIWGCSSCQPQSLQSPQLPQAINGGGGGGEEGSLSIYRFMRQPDQPSLVGASSTGHVKLFPRCGMDDNTAWMHGAVRHGGRLDQQVVVVVSMALFFARVVMREREGTCTSKSARQSSLRRCILLHQVLPRPSSACLTICKRTQV